MNPLGQVINTAHEGYGHAYYYELRRQGKDVNPYHEYKFVTIGQEWYEPLGTFIEISGRKDFNEDLVKQIKTVTGQARKNYQSRRK